MKTISNTINGYNNTLPLEEKKICDLLKEVIDANLNKATSKIWHGAPVWFLDNNPIVGYSKQKAGIRLMFWSGADFEEADLKPGTGKFKDASIFYSAAEQLNNSDVKRWLKKAVSIQWDYKNIVKRKGRLIKLSTISS